MRLDLDTIHTPLDEFIDNLPSMGDEMEICRKFIVEARANAVKKDGQMTEREAVNFANELVVDLRRKRASTDVISFR